MVHRDRHANEDISTRIYALYGCSRKVALFNFVLFLASIAGFLLVVIRDFESHHASITDAYYLPLPNCPSVRRDMEWAQWVPATAYEGILFLWVANKTLQSVMERRHRDKRCTTSLYAIILRDNILYFFGITCVLVINNLMVAGVTKSPWINYSPFHAAMEIMTSRMLINLYKAHERTKGFSIPKSTVEVPIQFRVDTGSTRSEEYGVNESII